MSPKKIRQEKKKLNYSQRIQELRVLNIHKDFKRQNVPILYWH